MPKYAVQVIGAIAVVLCGWDLPALDYLPADTKYNPNIPAPENHFGRRIGTRHLRHHELLGYMRKLAGMSRRVTCHEYARSYGQRPLIVLTITSPENHVRLEKIRRRHLRLADPTRSAGVPLDDLPAVLYMGYGVHGNEASAANASPLVAYHLAAGEGPQIESLLRHLVILLDPCLNPDGYVRFTEWVNDHRGRIPNPDSKHREHNEPWPSGRSNYYWFDLNRDWLPLQHPESRGRIALYRRWLPNLVLDFHEMNTQATFFFQPGVPSRKHPLIPRRNVQLTKRLAQFHASLLDQHGSLYFTEEIFDDFYVGKGSTYPDLHGAIGILFEQASTRGNVQARASGTLTFPFTIKNQVLASLSGLLGAQQLRLPLLEHKRDFYRDGLVLAGNGPVECYVVTAPGDPVRGRHFLEILLRHGIQVFELAQDFQADGLRFLPGESYVIPAKQPEFRYLTALFEKRTVFPEPTFYDVSAWTLPLAFNLRYVSRKEPLPEGLRGNPVRLPLRSAIDLTTAPSDVAHVIDWRAYTAPCALYRMLNAGLRVKVAKKPFGMEVNGRRREFGRGTLLVPRGIQEKGRRDKLLRMMQRVAQKDQVSVYAALSGLTPSGIDFGSSSFALVKKPQVLLVTGEGVSAYEAGEVWHLLDQRVRMPVTMVDAHRLGQTSLDDYTAIVLVSGSYGRVSDAGVERLKQWLTGGGTLISIGTATGWLKGKEIVDVRLRPPSDGSSSQEQAAEKPKAPRRPYADARREAARQLIRGAILKTEIDVTHPICFGYQDRELPVFRNNRVFLELAPSPYASPVIYAKEPLLSGYVSPENLTRLKGSASVVVLRKGKGRAILIADNPNFRAFWYGTNRLFLNSIFFGPLMAP